MTDSPEPLEVECPIIVGEFSVWRHGTVFSLLPTPSTMSASCLPKEGFPFFSGRLLLEKLIEVYPLQGRRIYIEIGNVRAAGLRMWINGVEVQPLLWRPWRREVTAQVRAGVNTIRVELSTTLFNLFGPHHSGHGERMWVGPWMWSEADGWTDDYTFIPYGMDGIRLVFESTDP